MKPTAINIIQSATQTSRRDSQRATAGDGDVFAQTLSREMAQKQTSRGHQAAQSVSRDNTNNEPADKEEKEMSSASQAALLASFWFVFGPQLQGQMAADASGAASEQMPNTIQTMQTLAGLINGQLDANGLSTQQNNQLTALSQLLADSNLHGLTVNQNLSGDGASAQQTGLPDQAIAQLLPTLETLLDAQIASQATQAEELAAGQTEKIAAMAEALSAHAAGSRSSGSHAYNASLSNTATGLSADLQAGTTLVQSLQSEQNGLADQAAAVDLAAIASTQIIDSEADEATALLTDKEQAANENLSASEAGTQYNSGLSANNQTAMNNHSAAVLSPDAIHHPAASVTATDTTTGRASETIHSAYDLAVAEFGQQENLLQVPGQAIASILSLTRGQQQEIRVRLYPDHLGEMHISLIQDGEGLSARIAADTMAACRLLEANLPQLQQALAERQIQCRHIDVQYQPAENSQSYNAADTNQQQSQTSQFSRQANTTGRTGLQSDNHDQPVSAAETAAATIANNPKGRINQIIW